MENTIPSYLAKYFWGDDINSLDPQLHQHYIIQSILENGDKKSISWLFSIYSQKTIKKTLSKLNLSQKSKNFWKIYLN